MKLYDYYRSTACYRVRIALNLKGLEYEPIPIHLLNDGGEHLKPGYLKINPQGLVPSLEVDGQMLNQSLSIIEFLEEYQPKPQLLPQTPIERAKARSLALIIACDIHPLNGLRVRNYLQTVFEADEAQILKWYHHWLKEGFKALEAHLSQIPKSPFCFGDKPGLVEVCLIPQIYNAMRFEFSLQDYPCVRKLNERCLNLEAFQKASP